MAASSVAADSLFALSELEVLKGQKKNVVTAQSNLTTGAMAVWSVSAGGSKTFTMVDVENYIKRKFGGMCEISVEALLRSLCLLTQIKPSGLTGVYNPNVVYTNPFYEVRPGMQTRMNKRVSGKHPAV